MPAERWSWSTDLQEFVLFFRMHMYKIGFRTTAGSHGVGVLKGADENFEYVHDVQDGHLTICALIVSCYTYVISCDRSRRKMGT